MHKGKCSSLMSSSLGTSIVVSTTGGGRCLTVFPLSVPKVTHQAATFVDGNGLEVEFNFLPEIKSEAITPSGVPDDIMDRLLVGLLDGLLGPNDSSNKGTSFIFTNWKSCHNKNMIKLNAPFLFHAHSWKASHPGVDWDVPQIISTFKPQQNLHVIKFENDKLTTLHHQCPSVGTPPIITQSAILHCIPARSDERRMVVA